MALVVPTSTYQLTTNHCRLQLCFASSLGDLWRSRTSKSFWDVQACT